MKLHQTFLLCGIFSISLLNSGCNDKQDAKIYSVAKETPAQATASADPHGGAMPAMAPPNHPSMGGGMAAQPAMGGTAAPEVNIGTAPEDWKMKPPTSMRLASFEVQAEKDAVADISLILLNGAAGGVLSNVNRWQSQLGQPELTEAELAQKAQRVDSPLGEMTVVDLKGLPSGADAAKDGRIVAAMVAKDGMMFFFKMRGNAELVGSQKENFLKWAIQVRTAADKPGTSASPAPSPAPANVPVEGAAIPSK